MTAALAFLALGAGCMAAIALLAWRKAAKASIVPFEVLLSFSLAFAALSAVSALWGFVAGMAALAAALYAACMAEASEELPAELYDIENAYYMDPEDAEAFR